MTTDTYTTHNPICPVSNGGDTGSGFVAGVVVVVVAVVVVDAFAP